MLSPKNRPLDTGDVVRLRSGGPKMTLRMRNGVANVYWFVDGGHELYSREVDPGMLTRVSESEESEKRPTDSLFESV